MSRVLCLLLCCLPVLRADDDRTVAAAASGNSAGTNAFLQQWCGDCHAGQEPAAGLQLPNFRAEQLQQDQSTWEKVIRRLQNGDMPPPGAPQPPAAAASAIRAELITTLDAYALAHPTPGRIDTLRRLNRTEYGNAIRDLLGLELDLTTLLPADESSQGFDNITVTGLSPVLLNRYVAAAQKISRMAMGAAERSPGGVTFRVAGDVTQDGTSPAGLPLGTRGGLLVDWYFPRDGEYEIQVRLMRDRNDEIEGLRGRHQLDVLLDRQRKQRFEIQRPQGRDDRDVDSALVARFAVAAGQHQLGVTFAENSRSLATSDRQPLNVSYNFYRHPRQGPAVYQVSITGPFGESAAGNSDVRRAILTRSDGEESEQAARQILTRLTRLAFRRPITDDDLQASLALFREGQQQDGSFDAGIERAVAGLLVNPQFLFRVEQEPAGPAKANAEVNPDANVVARISDVELASRLSFFLWSSLPDERLLELAERGELSRSETLAAEVARMLADAKAESLVTNFADQWLYLRNLDAVTPDARIFPDFGQNLRDAFRRETELLFADMWREDRPVTFLLDPPWTWLNERLARHYGIPQVQGDQFRRVALRPEYHRGGILRHGSILSVTSYATRTSPVLRGKWVLENLLGAPPPPPPPDVSDLEDNTVAASLPVRQRLAMHRADPACASCHDRIDPVGFALENFDAVGRWRETEQELPVDVSGGLPDGVRFAGVTGLEQALLERPDLFTRTLTEKLLVFALGRGLDPTDGAAVRTIVRDAAEQDYRFSAVVQGIAASVPFRMRQAAATATTASVQE